MNNSTDSKWLVYSFYYNFMTLYSRSLDDDDDEEKFFFVCKRFIFVNGDNKLEVTEMRIVWAKLLPHFSGKIKFRFIYQQSSQNKKSKQASKMFLK